MNTHLQLPDDPQSFQSSCTIACGASLHLDCEHQLSAVCKLTEAAAVAPPCLPRLQRTVRQLGGGILLHRQGHRVNFPKRLRQSWANASMTSSI